MAENRAAPCPACGETVACDDQGRIRWHQHADTPQDAYHLRGCAGSDQSATTGSLVAGATGTGTGDTAPRYTWIVRGGGGDIWVLLGYRWFGRKDALGTAKHWLHHYEKVKTVEVVGGDWTVIE